MEAWAGKHIGAIASLMFGLLVAMAGVIYSNLSSDIGELKTLVRETTKEIGLTRIEATKTVAAVDRQLGITNQKLDDLIVEIRRRR